MDEENPGQMQYFKFFGFNFFLSLFNMHFQLLSMAIHLNPIRMLVKLQGTVCERQNLVVDALTEFKTCNYIRTGVIFWCLSV